MQLEISGTGLWRGIFSFMVHFELIFRDRDGASNTTGVSVTELGLAALGA